MPCTVQTQTRMNKGLQTPEFSSPLSSNLCTIYQCNTHDNILVEAFTDLLLGFPVILEFPVILGSPVRWFLEFKNQTGRADSKRSVRKLSVLHVVKWPENHATGLLGILVTKP
jgi:hypothetical protein